MTASSDWIVWLTGHAGEVFLGLPVPSDMNQRFCVLGKFVEYLDGVGFWIDIDFVQKLEMPDNTVVKTWEVRPHSCLIPWNYISYIQRGQSSGKVGFIPTDSK
jgi:hypothetical protein